MLGRKRPSTPKEEWRRISKHSLLNAKKCYWIFRLCYLWIVKELGYRKAAYCNIITPLSI